MRSIILGSLLFIATAAAAQPLQVGLEMSPSKTLPGIPVSFRLTFTNGGPNAVAIPKYALLLVIPASGHGFAALWGGTPVAMLDGDGSVGKNGSVVRELASDGTLQLPRWFSDPRLAEPGTYQLQVYVGNIVTLDDAAQTLIERPAAVSNPVVLTVAEPKGEEAAIWNAMRALGEGRSWHPSMLFSPAGRNLMQRVVNEQPESPYAGWFATMGAASSDDKYAETLRNWLARHPDDPYAEWRMLRVAEWEVKLADRYAVTDPAKSKEHDKNAREALEKLKNAKHPKVRARVKDRLEYLSEPAT